ncbi:histidinol-phosphate transaminase [Sporomusa acidovorans]|uniref:Histidinol-phosphate aminotransferase n=1 Tax=Sporomusa acidovorans (strain ATCC 49682 / DSM 3132 / Mol) TaxID=1123286 RepID=A0ABZ3J5A2_SPOA4|nr:histidinol-phosphate transaminase [Sporomusa acidovorans]OZC23922.1 histidinol-phosphate aminotransferase 2 [Sporomusa acidovorans DSM 3132]SDF31175.1 histidinol-phosphate aminotransferase [Sporomusa acidovorans]
MFAPRCGLESLKPYSVEEIQWPVRLDANENPTDLPPAIKTKVMEKLAVLPFNRYPEMSAISLKSTLAAGFGLKAANVLVGNGSSEILEALCHAFGGAGRSIVYPSPSFSMYGIYAKLADSQSVPVALNADYTLDADKLLAAAKEAAAVVILLCNPNNPTGMVMPLEQIEYIVAGTNSLVVVDEAYHEFYGKTAVNLLRKYQNVAIARTFSKAYSLAAARVGYLLTNEEIARTIGKVLLPYSVNALTLATAEIVYGLRQEFAGGLAVNSRERERMAAVLSALDGVTVYPSQTNFLLVKSENIAAMVAKLSARGIGIRDFSTAPGLTNCIRISVGTPEENKAVLEAVTA